MPTYIVVNRHVIQENNRNRTRKPPIRISKSKHGKAESYASEVDILDADGNVVASLVYDHEKPIMKCGARLVLVAKHGVILDPSTKEG